MWPFKSETVPGSRGPRYDEQSFLVQRGDTFVLWVSKMDFMKRATNYPGENPNALFPPGVEEIPAFSLLEVHVMSKSGDPTKSRATMELVPRASCIRFCTVRAGALSPYSYIDSLRAMPASLEAARHAALAKREDFPVISKDVEAQDVAFFLRTVCRAATLSEHALESDGLVSVCGWSEDPMDAGAALDVPVAVLLRQTNAADVVWARTLLELAINMGCVEFLVFTSDYFRKGGGGANVSHLRAVPVLDTRRLFAAVRWDACVRRVVRADGDFFLFDTGATHRAEDGTEQPITLAVVKMGETPFALEGPPLPTTDLIVCEPVFAVPRAHRFWFCLGRGEEGVPLCVLRGALRVGASASQAPGAHKRARLGCVYD
jgi:hypothetical protein